MKLTVTSYNICAGKSYQHYPDKNQAFDPSLTPFFSLVPAAQTLLGIKPQIVGVNEVDYMANRSGHVDMAAELGNMTGLEGVFGKALHLKGPAFGEGSLYGNGLLSQFSLLEKEEYPIENPKRDEKEYYEQRGILRVKLDVSGGITVFVTHLGLSIHERQNGVMLLCRLLDETKGPVILMGDFNMRPWDFLHNPLRDRLTDTALVLGVEPATFPSCSLNYPDCKIDYIYVSKHFKIRSFYAVDSKASDHLPIVAELEL